MGELEQKVSQLEQQKSELEAEVQSLRAELKERASCKACCKEEKITIPDYSVPAVPTVAVRSLTRSDTGKAVALMAAVFMIGLCIQQPAGGMLASPSSGLSAGYPPPLHTHGAGRVLLSMPGQDSAGEPPQDPPLLERKQLFLIVYPLASSPLPSPPPTRSSSTSN